jgi:hypothetical protein
LEIQRRWLIDAIDLDRLTAKASIEGVDQRLSGCSHPWCFKCPAAKTTSTFEQAESAAAAARPVACGPIIAAVETTTDAV